MEPIITMILFAVALFVLFLMFTSGHRKHKLDKVLNELQTERMRLMKSIEHVKLSFYQRKIDEKDAQDKIFGYEEKLREIEAKILEIKEKPLMRTVKKQEERGKGSPADDTAQEEIEVERSEAEMVKHMDAKAIVVLLIILVVGVILVMGIVGPVLKGDQQREELEPIVISMDGRAVPEQGTPPGSTAGLRVNIENTHDEPLEDIFVWTRAPQGSGISFEDGEIGVKQVKFLDVGGTRELFYGINVSQETPEGEYVIGIDALNDERLNTTATARLTVRIGRPDEDEEITNNN